MTSSMFAAMFGRVRAGEQLRAHGASLKRRTRVGISVRVVVSASQFCFRIFRKHQPGTAAAYAARLPFQKLISARRPRTVAVSRAPALAFTAGLNRNCRSACKAIQRVTWAR
jgi:hypothetical protein